MTTYTQTLVLREPKKHSVRYDAPKDDTSPILTSIYISKLNLPRDGKWPQTIKITLEYE